MESRSVIILLCSIAVMRDVVDVAAAAAADFTTATVTTTTVFDPSKRGKLMYGDTCSNTVDCGFANSICDGIIKTCACSPEFPATNHVDKCGRAASINESCFFNDQCEELVLRSECRDGRCVCRYEMVPELFSDGTVTCVAVKEEEISTRTIDPAMIGVLVGMALMFVIICVVFRLFSKARWSETRTIFNTPNPRLMNVSLLKDTKHGQERRGSRVSMRPPSRQTSQSELRPHSPTHAPHHANHQQHHPPLPLQRKHSALRRGSRTGSTYSGNSVRSHKSPVSSPQPNNNHSTTTPMLESVTIEIREPKP